MKDANGVVKRTGRTGNLAAREAQHKVGKETSDLTFESVHRTDDYAEQRGLEHMLYDAHKGTASKANGGLNKAKAIRDNNPNKPDYLKAAEKYLGNQ